MRFKELFKEGKNIGYLYHFTSIKNALLIVKQNKLLPGNTGIISFSRSKSLIHYPTDFSKQISFIIDGNKLSNNYRLTPYSYHYLDQNVVNKTDEMEERLDTGKMINDIKKYIIKIIIYKNLYYSSIVNNVKNNIIYSKLLGKSIDYEVNIEDIVSFFKINKIETEIM